jgi:hypothetical protein
MSAVSTAVSFKRALAAAAAVLLLGLRRLHRR